MCSILALCRRANIYVIKYRYLLPARTGFSYFRLYTTLLAKKRNNRIRGAKDSPYGPISTYIVIFGEGRVAFPFFFLSVLVLVLGRVSRVIRRSRKGERCWRRSRTRSTVATAADVCGSEISAGIRVYIGSLRHRRMRR